jgi:hypothetical protein
VAAKQKSNPQPDVPAVAPAVTGEVVRVGKGKRTAWTPTPEERQTAITMAAVGVSRQQISVFFGVHNEALQRELGDEIDRAEVQAVAKVAQTLYRRATEGNDLGAAIFYLKARGGWRETPAIDLGGAGGLAIHIHL